MSASKRRPRIVRGDHKDLIVSLIDQKTELPYHLDITTPLVTEIVARFRNEDGTCTEKKLSVGVAELEVTSEEGGVILVHLLPADTALLELGEMQDFEVKITKSGKDTTSQFFDKIDVVDPIC